MARVQATSFTTTCSCGACLHTACSPYASTCLSLTCSLIKPLQAFCDEHGTPQRSSCDLKPLERQLCLDRKMRTFYRDNFSHRCCPKPTRAARCQVMP